MRKGIIACIFILLFLAHAASAQSVSVINNRRSVVIEFGSPIAPADKPALENPANYSFYELFDPKGINIKAIPIPDLRVNSAPTWRLSDTWLVLPVNQPLKFGTVYLLKIDNANLPGNPVIRFEISSDAAAKVFNLI